MSYVAISIIVELSDRTREEVERAVVEAVGCSLFDAPHDEGTCALVCFSSGGGTLGECSDWLESL